VVEVVQGAGADKGLCRVLLKQNMVTDHRVAAYSDAIAAWLEKHASGAVYAVTQDMASTRL
jgi:phage gp36-like protein